MPKPQLRSAASNGAFIMKAFDHVNRNINIFLGYEKKQQKNRATTTKSWCNCNFKDHAEVNNDWENFGSC